MDKLQHIQSAHIPAMGTQARKVLELLSDGLSHPKKDLINILEDDPRSALQALRGKQYGFWLIHNIGDKKGVYLLDERHMSGDKDDDISARIKSEIQFRERSTELAQRESNRLPKALLEEVRTKSRLQQSFDFLLLGIKKKPTSVK